MIQIKFNNETESHDCTIFRRINPNVIMLDFNTDNTSGFCTYKEEEQLGDFSDYTTVYRHDGNNTYYSNDGSTWVEPKKNVLFNIYWNSPEDVTLPDSINVTIKGEEEKTITIEKAKDWTYELICLQHENYTITATEEVADFTYIISGNSVEYTYSKVVPTWQDEIEAQLTYTALMTDTLLKEE